MSLTKCFLSFLAAVSISTPAFAEDKDHKGHHKGGDVGMENHFSPEKLKELGLSPEQKNKLKDIRQAHREDGKQVAEQMKAARKSFKESLKSDASKEEVTKAFETMMAKKSELSKVRLSGLLEARDVLTKEQRAKLFSKED